MARKAVQDDIALLHIVPAWINELVLRRVRETENRDIHFVMETTVQRSGRDHRKGRLIIPSDFKPNVVRLLSPAERAKIFKNREKKPPLMKRAEEKPKYAKVKVKVFVRSGWMFHMNLARSCRDDTLMIKGREWKYVLALCGFRQNDAVEMWAFRCRLPPPPPPQPQQPPCPSAGASSSNSSSDHLISPPPESLCLILGKKENSL